MTKIHAKVEKGLQDVSRHKYGDNVRFGDNVQFGPTVKTSGKIMMKTERFRADELSNKLYTSHNLYRKNQRYYGGIITGIYPK